MVKKSSANKKLTAKELQPEGLPCGIYFGLPEDQYHDDPALNYSSMKHMLEGESHFWHQSNMNPNRKRFVRTERMRLGVAQHRLLLEPGTFKDHYFVVPGDSGGGAREMLGRSVYLSLCEAIATLENFLSGSPELLDLIRNGYPEVTIIWEDEETGVRCKARHDLFKSYCSVDYKRTDSIRANRIRNKFYEFCYDIQGYHYTTSRQRIRQMIKAGTADIYGEVDMKFMDAFLENEDDDGFIFIFQQDTAPFTPLIIEMEPDTWNRGATNSVDAIRRYAKAIERWGTDTPWGSLDGAIQSFSINHGIVRH